MKFDIYNAMKTKDYKLLIKYKNELNIAYNYLIDQFYKKVGLGYSLTYDGRECLEEIIVTKKNTISEKAYEYI